LFIPSTTAGVVLCRKCQKSQVVADAMQLMKDVDALRRGLPPYDCLTSDERAEQLSGFAVDFTGTADTTSPQFPGFRTLSDEALIEIVGAPAGTLPMRPGEREEDAIAEASAELVRRLDNAALTVAISRDETERRIAVQ
jgi:hypothetical protein